MGASVVTHGDPAPVFKAPEHVLDFMALFVEGLIVIIADFAVFLRWNAGRNSLFHQGLPEPVGIISAVAQPFVPDSAGNIPFFSRLAAVRWALRCVASIT